MYIKHRKLQLKQLKLAEYYLPCPLWILFSNQIKLEMWANAQRDGRPAEYRWRPLFNAAKFG